MCVAVLSNKLDNLPSSWCLSGVGVEPQVRVTKSSAKLVKFQFYLCWLFYVLRIESVWCIVRGLFSFVGTQSPFFLDQKSKACWRWTKKMAKWSNREREWAYLSTIHTAPGLLVLALSLFVLLSACSGSAVLSLSHDHGQSQSSSIILLTII